MDKNPIDNSPYDAYSKAYDKLKEVENDLKEMIQQRSGSLKHCSKGLAKIYALKQDLNSHKILPELAVKTAQEVLNEIEQNMQDKDNPLIIFDTDDDPVM